LLNSAVIAALVLDQAIGLTVADAGFGIAIALWLLFNAARASSHAIDQLMDKEWPEDLRARFWPWPTTIRACGHPRPANPIQRNAHFAQFHVWVPGDWTCRRHTTAWTGWRWSSASASRARNS
jgi:ferrous-iron efflux pump FieF